MAIVGRMHRALSSFGPPSVVLIASLFASCSSDELPPGSSGTRWIPGCENAGEIGIDRTPRGAASPDAGTTPLTSIPDEATLFATQIGPNLDDCRKCHVAGGVADTEKGRRFRLTRDKGEDRGRLQAAWEALGRGVETNLLLLKPSNTAPEKHTGGKLWPADGPVYGNMRILLSCWNDPASCAAQLKDAKNTEGAVEYPLLGDLEATGGRNYAALYCQDKPDCATLPQDPRELIAGKNIDNPNYSVYFNDPFEVCVNDRLLATQARQNQLLDEQGSTEPRYTAKARPKNCGEWRRDVSNGRRYIMTTPFSGAMLTVVSIINISNYLKNPLPTDVASANAALAAISQQRYGWPQSPYRNPAPFPGEDPNLTDGGSLQLPVALAQVKDEQGKWTGKIGLTCFVCHSGQIGAGEVLGGHGAREYPEIAGGSPNGLFLGLNGANTDAALALFDTDQANGLYGPNSMNAVIANPGYMAGRTRGVNAADQEIVSVLTGRDFDTLDFRDESFMPMNGGKEKPPLLNIIDSGGDQDIPSWWWTHNKSRYLWTGFGSNGSVRGNYFAATANPHDGHWSKNREADFQDMDQWLNTVEAPKFVGPAVDLELAEQGAILFHSKDLWADPANADIPRPGGNGSCAGCHGAYSPRYIHQPGYLPDPRLGGMSGYTVPLAIVGTDKADSDFFNMNSAGLFPAKMRKVPNSLANLLWMSYPDANEGYVVPEERTHPLQAPNPRSEEDPKRVCGLGTLGGYVAQSLHGVWASAPYFHNGSVPTVWDVLKPSDRPNVWRRQQIPASEGVLGFRGYDTRLDRAYDYEKLGWKYERLTCNPSESAPYNTTCKKGLDAHAPPGPNAVDDRTVYNTNAFSKGNQGHDYVKVLTDAERRALIEYLKTL